MKNKYIPMKIEAKQADKPENVLQGKVIVYFKISMFLIVSPYGMVIFKPPHIARCSHLKAMASSVLQHLRGPGTRGRDLQLCYTNLI